MRFEPDGPQSYAGFFCVRPLSRVSVFIANQSPRSAGFFFGKMTMLENIGWLLKLFAILKILRALKSFSLKFRLERESPKRRSKLVIGLNFRRD